LWGSSIETPLPTVGGDIISEVEVELINFFFFSRCYPSTHGRGPLYSSLIYHILRGVPQRDVEFPDIKQTGLERRAKSLELEGFIISQSLHLL
jgi:hypothetical protein